MLLKLLNTNQPSILFLLPILSAILWLPFLLNPVVADSHIVTSYVIVFKKDLLMDGHIGTILALAISNLTAIFINRIVNNSDLCNKPAFVYAFVYILLEAALRTNSGFYTWQISGFLIIASFWPLLQIYNQRNVINLSFEIGLFLAIATIFYQPSIIFLFIIPIFLQVFRTFNWREWLFPIIGFSLVFLFYGCYRYITNEHFFTYFIFEKFNFKSYYSSQEIVFITGGILLLFGINNYAFGARKAIMHARKQRFVFLLMFVIVTAMISALNYTGFTFSGYFIVLGIAAIITGYYLANARFKWFAEIAFLALIFAQLLKFNI